MSHHLEHSIVGCLLGTAVGDALGLPSEGMTNRRHKRFYTDLSRYHFVFGRGMTSDDTEHACMVAQTMIVSAGEADKFIRDFGRRLRFWLLGVPASIGLATLRAIVKLWMGFPAHRSGVFSAGNGPAMRSAIIGVCYGHDGRKLRDLVRASTRITHTDPRAEYGALAVAVAAWMSSQERGGPGLPEDFYQTLQELLDSPSTEFTELIQQVSRSVSAGRTTDSFAIELGLEKAVTGYVYHTVPIALHVWLCHPTDYRSAVLEAVRCGGDTDTVAAIVGGIVGARVGRGGIPQEWLDGLWEWPRSIRWMEKLGQRLAKATSEGTTQRSLPLPLMGLVLRNLFFLLVVLAHGLRRLLPPY